MAIRVVPLGPGGLLVLTPETGFGVHSTDGVALTVRLGEATVLRAAHAYEQAVDWHTRSPLCATR